jgi:hypothetical protein
MGPWADITVGLPVLLGEDNIYLNIHSNSNKLKV